MRRADRLFQLVQLIRGRRLSTAAFLAARLQVSLRTVYRDVADLAARGVPIEGAAGVGYRMRAGFDLPPLMFSVDEACALVAAVRMAQPRLDAALALHAEGALSKVMAVLPPATRAAAESLSIFAPELGMDEPTRAHLLTLRQATAARRKLRLRYRDLQEARTERTVHPLGSFFWGQVWTLGAWCEQREDFRSFRVDRIERVEVLEAVFRNQPGHNLAEFLRRQQRPD